MNLYKLTEANNLVRRTTRLTKLVNMNAPDIIAAHELRFIAETIARIAQELESSTAQEEIEGIIPIATEKKAQEHRNEWNEMEDEHKKARLSTSVHFMKESVDDIEEIISGYKVSEDK